MSSLSRARGKNVSKQESPPAWTQEAYRPQEGARCCSPPPPAGPDPPPPLAHWPDPPPRQLDLTRPPPIGSLTWPPPASWTWPPLGSLTWPPPPPGRLDLTPPQVWTKWKHYLPHPSDAGGKKHNVFFCFTMRCFRSGLSSVWCPQFATLGSPAITEIFSAEKR